MKRHETPFPKEGDYYDFLQTAWCEGWFDEYSAEHFLIKAINGQLEEFVGKEQLVENNINMHGFVNPDHSVDMTAFCDNLCINLSSKLSIMERAFGTHDVKRFVVDQLSAGKKNYSEDTFFQAMSEISILCFYLNRFNWSQTIYEPPVSDRTKKNPEARFVGLIPTKITDNGEILTTTEITINVEVKSPAFPHDLHRDRKVAIPTVLLSERGKTIVKSFCTDNDIEYLDPRLHKLKEFLNSAASKFQKPTKDEINILYINWSYRDFPTNSYLEAWSLLTNDINGILTKPEVAKQFGVISDVFEKITAVVVYTESLEGVLFSDFRFVWQSNRAGQRFRIWIVDEELRKNMIDNPSSVWFSAMGMNPSDPLTQLVMADFKSTNLNEQVKSVYLSLQLKELIEDNALN